MDYLPEVTQHYQHVSEFDSDIVNQANENGNNLNTSLTHSHKSTESESSHTSERKVSQQHPMQQHMQQPHQEREAIYQKHGFTQRHAEQVQVIPEGSIPPMRYRNSETHRSERSQLMRAYEQRQAQRQAHYAAMERENETDARLRQVKRQKLSFKLFLNFIFINRVNQTVTMESLAGLVAEAVLQIPCGPHTT